MRKFIGLIAVLMLMSSCANTSTSSVESKEDGKIIYLDSANTKLYSPSLLHTYSLMGDDASITKIEKLVSEYFSFIKEYEGSIYLGSDQGIYIFDNQELTLNTQLCNGYDAPPDRRSFVAHEDDFGFWLNVGFIGDGKYTRVFMTNSRCDVHNNIMAVISSKEGSRMHSAAAVISEDLGSVSNEVQFHSYDFISGEEEVSRMALPYIIGECLGYVVRDGNRYLLIEVYNSDISIKPVFKLIKIDMNDNIIKELDVSIASSDGQSNSLYTTNEGIGYIGENIVNMDLDLNVINSTVLHPVLSDNQDIGFRYFDQFHLSKDKIVISSKVLGKVVVFDKESLQLLSEYSMELDGSRYMWIGMIMVE